MIINLDKTFSPYGDGVEYESFIFPSGCEAHFKLESKYANLDHEFSGRVLITTRIRSSDDLMTLLMATDALKRSGATDISLFIPYLPYARQDRQMVFGEPLSLKVFANLINAQGYTKVTFYDVHSAVSTALIDNSKSFTNHEFVAECLNDKKNYLIVSPDSGAYKKIFDTCKYIEYDKDIIIGGKVRDLKTGKILETTVSHGSLSGMDCYIIDDICDGGGTFILLAEELKRRNAGNIHLIVSHGIFSKGYELPGIDRIYTTNSFKDINDSRITQINLTDGLLSR